ncbi:MAG: hypothetical protein H6492_01950, partial [Candidatus Paracaedibacteraceae bacterium]|nr:hypothetical protein [Candidatus Paracaedibacteraceae bacterium]
TAKIEIAREMLVDNVPVSSIAKYTGLTTEEVEAIRDGTLVDERT